MTVCWNCGSAVADDAQYCLRCPAAGHPRPLTLGRYRVVSMLGRGGFGEVYKCADPTIRRNVAVKRMVRPFSSPDAVDEARMVGRLNHPNVVKVFDLDEVNGLIVMELAEGGSLAHLLETDPDQARADFSRILLGACEGLRAAHLSRVMHRDLKPANILLSADNDGMISDFGIARVVATDDLAVTQIGTAPYMAPEALLGSPYSFDADLHSLGCVIYEVFAGRPPFDQETALGLAIAKQNAHYTPLREVAPDVDDLLSRLVDRMLARPTDRSNLSIQQVMDVLLEREPGARGLQVRSIDDLQRDLSLTYWDKNRESSPIALLLRYGAALSAAAEGLENDDDPAGRAQAEEFFPKAFAWLCALLSRVNARLSQLIWLKFENVCPYCEAVRCVCGPIPFSLRKERNDELLRKMVSRLASSAPSANSFAEYQAMFLRIYGQVNGTRDIIAIARHADKEIYEVADALFKVGSLERRDQVEILHLELADLIAWFFALLNSHRDSYNFVQAFDSVFSDGCYLCASRPCRCTDDGDDMRLVTWRSV